MLQAHPGADHGRRVRLPVAHGHGRQPRRLRHRGRRGRAARPRGRRSSAAISATPASTPWGWPTRETVQRARAADGGAGRRGPRTARVRRAGAPAAASEARRRGKGNEGIFCGAAIELPDGTIVTGKNSPLMHAASSLVLNAVKHLAGIPDTIHLLSPTHHRVDGAASRRTSCSAQDREPGPGGDADRAGHQRRDQPGGAAGHGEAEGPARLRGAHDPHPDARATRRACGGWA